MTELPENFDGFVSLGGTDQAGFAEQELDASPMPGPSSFGQLLDQGLELLRENFLSLTLLSAGATFLTYRLTTDALWSDASGGMFGDGSGVLILVGLISTCFGVVVQSGLGGALAMARHTTSKQTGFPALLQMHYVRGLVSMLVTGICVLLATVPIFPIGIYIAFRLTAAPTAAFHEGLGPFAAIRRSWLLTGGRDLFGRWIGLLFTAWMLALIPGSLATGVLSGGFHEVLSNELNLDLASVDVVLYPLAYYLMGIDFAIRAALMGRFQLDILARREGVDLRRRLRECFPVGTAR